MRSERQIVIPERIGARQRLCSRVWVDALPSTVRRPTLQPVRDPTQPPPTERHAGACDDDELGQKLLQAVYNHPEDRELRLIYGDWLQERGDPQGELIALQCCMEAQELTPTATRRINALIRKHGMDWLGPLRPIVMKQNLRFAQGFPASVLIRDCPSALLKPLIGNPAWATIEEVDFISRSVQGGMDHEVMRSLRAVGGLDAPHLIEIATARPGRIKVLGVNLGYPDELTVKAIAEALMSCAELRWLHLSQHGPEDLVVPLLLHGAGKQLETLGLGHRHLNLTDLLVDVEHFLPQLVTLILETSNDNASVHRESPGWIVTFTRDMRGEFTRLKARFRPYPNDHFSLAFRQLTRRVLPLLDRKLSSVTVEVAGQSLPEEIDLAELEQAMNDHHPGAERGGILGSRR